MSVQYRNTYAVNYCAILEQTVYTVLKINFFRDVILCC
jgi:hypothetical protein